MHDSVTSVHHPTPNDGRCGMGWCMSRVTHLLHTYLARHVRPLWQSILDLYYFGESADAMHWHSNRPQLSSLAGHDGITMASTFERD
jgi:hypothetical protein